MKKLSILLLVLVMLLCLASGTFAAESGVHVYVGSTLLKGEFEMKEQTRPFTEIYYDANELQIGVEAFGAIGDNWELGLGYNKQLMGEIDFPGQKTDFSFANIYLAINYFMGQSKLSPYLALRLGGTTFECDDFAKNYELSSGAYGAIGIGIKPLDKLRIQALYSVADATIEFVDNDSWSSGNSGYNLIFRRIVFTVGYVF